MRTSIKYDVMMSSADKKVISSGKNKYEILAVFLIALTVFSLPSILRWTYFDNPSIIGFPTYLHQRQALDLDGYDDLSFGGREYTYPPLFSRAIAGFSLLMPIHIAGLLLVAIMGAVSAVFFYVIVREHISRRYALLSSILLILVPGTIYFNAHLSSRAPPFALGMAAIYFLLRKNSARKNLSALADKNIIIAGIFFGIAALFHPETAFFFGLVGLFRAVKDRNIFLSLLIAVAIASAYYLPFVATHGFPEVNALHEEYRTRQYSLESTSIQTFFFELAPNGYLTFAIVGLAVFGLAKKRHMFLLYWFLLALAFALIAERFAVYLAVPIVLLAVYALAAAEKKKWFKTVLVLLLIYSVFLAAAKIAYFSQFYPTKEQYNTMLWIKENTPPNATILSDWSWGHWITGIAERRNFADGYAEYAPHASERIAKLEQFYRTCNVPEGYNISYVYMEQWFEKSYNILCLDKFVLIYNNTVSQVYKV